ncbi:helix-turn-helix domain-containing protein [Romeria aff. gracilis LEGE 07310]|uniref:Helix-turn-helix domain-containing protein n=1 Tax=Vasconcelosia minhoensis LEGE 07310 TaxID=915328 RepID=A0A8J7DMX9_9CYAN|nr:helix-turn-helix domain-containing protein [Romeria gracilis]MBE9079536.1 helix-turn-helix domain-containing protein [Romeria aff. gracilis LEGE 07310]
MTKYNAAQWEQLSKIGAFLRETREKHDKSLDDIAISTYIRPPILAALEAADPDRLPEPVYVQGFIRRYAEALGLDGQALAQQFSGLRPAAPRGIPADLPPRTTNGIPFGRSPQNSPPSNLAPSADTARKPVQAPVQATEAAAAPTTEPDSAETNGNQAQPLVAQAAAIAAEPTLPSDPPDPAAPAPISVPTPYSPKAPSSSARSSQSINFTPYALAGILAVLVVGAVALLANLSGSRPAAEVEPVAEAEAPEVAEPPAPPVAATPEPAPPPEPVSEAPVYVSLDTTGNAWISVIADGRKVFEGTLPPGESQLWEAQQSIDVFTGNAGAVLLSHNGSEPAPMGELGKTSQAIYTADSAE